MLSKWTEHDQSETVRYWPRDRNDRLSFGDLLVTLHLSNNHKYWVERRLNITNLVVRVCSQSDKVMCYISNLVVRVYSHSDKVMCYKLYYYVLF